MQIFRNALPSVTQVARSFGIECEWQRFCDGVVRLTVISRGIGMFDDVNQVIAVINIIRVFYKCDMIGSGPEPGDNVNIVFFGLRKVEELGFRVVVVKIDAPTRGVVQVKSCINRYIQFYPTVGPQGE